MKRRICCAILIAAWLFVAPAAGFAQSSDVTFKVPVNLTQIPSDITKVAVSCSITSAAFPGGTALSGGTRVSQQEFTVTGAQVVTTATVVVPASLSVSAVVGVSATYTCELKGFSQSLQLWDSFQTSSKPSRLPLLSPTPVGISGTFTW